MELRWIHPVEMKRGRMEGWKGGSGRIAYKLENGLKRLIESLQNKN